LAASFLSGSIEVPLHAAAARVYAVIPATFQLMPEAAAAIPPFSGPSVLAEAPS
jgi:hypothetical protein